MGTATWSGFLLLSICLSLGAFPANCSENFEFGLTGLYDPEGDGDMTAEVFLNAPLFLGFSGRIAGGITADGFDAFREGPFDRYQFLLSAETNTRLNALLGLYAGGGFGTYRGEYSREECYEETPGYEFCETYVEKYSYTSPHLYGGLELDLGLPLHFRAGARWIIDKGPISDGGLVYEGALVFEIGNGDNPTDTPPPVIHGEDIEGNGQWNAYVFIGSITGAASVYKSAIISAADEAQSDFEDAGYFVIPNHSATYKDFKTVMLDPQARAFWYAGHGVEDETGPLPMIKDVNGEGITPTEKLYPSDATILFRKDNLNQVTIHACKQDLPEWRAAFVGATYDSWTTKPIGSWMYWWQLFATYPEIDQETGREIGWRSSEGIAPIGPDTYFGPMPVGRGTSDCGCEESVCEAGFPSDKARVDDPEFKDQSFNFYVSNDDFSQARLLLSAAVKNGRIDKPSVSFSPRDASFDVTMTHEAVRRSIEDRGAVDKVLAEGKVRIDSKVAQPSEGVLITGFGQLVFLTNVK